VNGRRVVVTGLGALTPAGHDVPSTWASLKAGRSAVERAPRLEAAGCRSHIAAEVRGFDGDRLSSRQNVARLGRSAQFALAAALEAWRNAGLGATAVNLTRCGVVLGTGFGDAAETFQQSQNYLLSGVHGINPAYVSRAMVNAGAAHVSLEFGLRGPSFTVGSACASAGHAIGLAARLIRWGDADVVLTGGTEEISCVLAAAAFDNLHALSVRNEAPAHASRPFERTRDGFVIGEGAAVLVLEAWEHALRRGARTYAEIAGVGFSSEAHHLVAPDPTGEGAALAMRRALDDAGRQPADVGYVNAHGTSTRLNDVMETRAIHQVLGAHARTVAVSSTKSMIGHLIGASAGVGLLATVLTVHEGIVHPTINYAEPDLECDLDYVPNVARRMAVDLALANSFAFGGHCVSVAVQPPPAS
jgi:3-oxoacyl-[acyl-carrier-protein] synthase II